MKLYNTIIVFDVYTVSDNPEAAMAAALALIRDAAPLAPSEQVANEATEAKQIRTAWQNERPIVAADISDEDFETLKGKTTTEAHAMLYKKIEPTK